jgi:hypothetical protein
VGSYEVQRARHTYADHDHAHCAACGERLTGPHQATAQTKGRGAWARECGACGVVTWYDVDNEEASHG